MATKYFALLTNIGAAKLANATALGAQVEITQMAVGDGNGALPTPNPAQTTLTHELRRAQLNMLTIDPVNTNQIIAEQVIPEDVGGWWIREIGLFDKDGDMIAIANCAETYKPQLQEGSGRVQVIRVILIVSNTEAVTLKIDPSVVLATRGYVDNLIETRQQKSDTLTALAALKPAKGKLPYFTAEKAAALADLSDFIRLMLNKGDAAGVLEYLGLGEGSALPVGAPVPWPSETPPTGWLKCNGAPFSAEEYPELAKVYPTNELPDLRGEFIRGWD
ncbi:phage tail protein, partial [Escherichia coli]|nr:phage tail protein [Escherichia coli]